MNPIVIYQRRSPETQLSVACNALLRHSTKSHVVFETEEWLQVALDLFYYVEIKAPKGEPALYRKLEIPRHPGQSGPYTYLAELGEQYRPPAPAGESKAGEETNEPPTKTE